MFSFLETNFWPRNFRILSSFQCVFQGMFCPQCAVYFNLETCLDNQKLKNQLIKVPWGGFKRSVCAFLNESSIFCLPKFQVTASITEILLSFRSCTTLLAAKYRKLLPPFFSLTGYISFWVARSESQLLLNFVWLFVESAWTNFHSNWNRT